MFWQVNHGLNQIVHSRWWEINFFYIDDFSLESDEISADVKSQYNDWWKLINSSLEWDLDEENNVDIALRVDISLKQHWNYPEMNDTMKLECDRIRALREHLILEFRIGSRSYFERRRLDDAIDDANDDSDFHGWLSTSTYIILHMYTDKKYCSPSIKS